MIKLGNSISIAPEQIFIVFFGLILLTVFVTFLLPPLLSAGRSSASFIDSFRKVKKHFLLTLFLVVLAVVVLGGSAFLYFASLPTVITAEDFKNTESEILKEIETMRTEEVVQKGDIYLIDIRNNFDFVNSHLAGSVNIQSDDLRLIDDIQAEKLVLYSSKDNFDTVYQEGRNIKLAHYNNFFTTVYVIEDGFEGLQNAEIKTSAGSTAEEEDK